MDEIDEKGNVQVLMIMNLCKNVNIRNFSLGVYM